jgi:type I restriction-modification system DNA methylase subunit
MKIAHWSLGILLVMPMGIAAGQAQPPAQDAQAPAPTPATSDSLVAAAKAAREAKKDQPKPARVWNDDTIPKSNGAISVVGQTPADDNAAAATGDAANSAAGADASAGAGAGAAAGTGNRGALETSIQNAKEKLATIKVDLDLLQRKYTLDSQMYYVKPDFASDTEGAAKLKDEQDQIAAKQQEMDELQKKIDDMEAELSKLPAAATPPASDNSN